MQGRAGIARGMYAVLRGRTLIAEPEVHAEYEALADEFAVARE